MPLLSLISAKCPPPPSVSLFKGLKLLRLIWINLTTSKQCLNRSQAVINCMYTSGDHTCFKLTTQVPEMEDLRVKN